MKRLIILILFLIISVWIGVEITKDPGYVLFSYSDWTVEMPLWCLILIFILALFMTHFFLRIIEKTGLIPQRIKKSVAQYRINHARKLTTQGLIELTEGAWKKAEHHLIEAVKNTDIPVLNYLAAARAAHEQAHYEQRDNYLRLAHNCSTQTQTAVSLTQAQLQLGHQQFEQALATLTHLQNVLPHHTYVLRLLKRLYVELKDYEHLVQLLPSLKKYNVLKPNELAELELFVYNALLNEAATKNNSASALQNTWNTLPKKLKQDPECIIHYVQLLINLKLDILAEPLLTQTLRHGFNERLIYLYGLIESRDPEKQLHFTEAFLKHHPKNAMLLLTLGRVAMHNRLWGKARSYFETSSAIAAHPETYRELGKLLEQLNEPAKAFECYKKGLESSL